MSGSQERLWLLIAAALIATLTLVLAILIKASHARDADGIIDPQRRELEPRSLTDGEYYRVWYKDGVTHAEWVTVSNHLQFVIPAGLQLRPRFRMWPHGPELASTAVTEFGAEVFPYLPCFSMTIEVLAEGSGHYLAAQRELGRPSRVLPIGTRVITLTGPLPGGSSEPVTFSDAVVEVSLSPRRTYRLEFSPPLGATIRGCQFLDKDQLEKQVETILGSLTEVPPTSH